MKGLQSFSIRGLRKLQNVLFLAGFLLVPFVFFVDLPLVKYLLALSFIGLFLGFRKTEKIIGKKQHQKRIKQVEKEMDTFHEECIQALRHMEGIFMNKGYSIKQNENEILNSLYRHLDSCTTVKDYLKLKETIQRRLVFVSSIANHKEDKQYYQKQSQSKRKERTASLNALSKHLQVLGLPEDTKDIVVIKNAYKKMIKAYHPDINDSLEAGKKTIELNLAYEELRKHTAS